MLWRRLVLQIAWMVNYIPLIVVLMCPRLIWGPITQEAAVACNQPLLRKLTQLPWLLGPVLVLNLALALIFFCVIWSDNDTSHGKLAVGYSVGCIASSLYGTGVLIWSGVLGETARYVVEVSRAWMAAYSKSESSFNRVLPVSAVSRAASARSMLTHASVRRLSNTALTGLPGNSIRLDAPAHQKQIVLGYTAFYLLCSSSGTTAVDYYLMWAMRLGILFLMFTVKDKISSHEDLKKDGAALGLVLDADKMRKALLRVQKGEQLVDDIPTFRANIFRMRYTLAVSYRWKPNGITITESGLSINMDSFQIGALAEEIRHSGCSYVWIDKLSVFQTRGSLQRTLLSRMLAVYSGANTTIAIKTAEGTQRDRYHSRAWTAQVIQPD